MTAREWLELVRVAAGEIEPLQRELSGLIAAHDQCVSWHTSHGGGGSCVGTHSDPTASLAQARMSELDAMVADVKSKLDERINLVGECGELLMRMERELGRKYREVIEIYYIDLADTWSEVACEMGITYRHVQRLRDVAYEWMDRHVR
jgi:hypothetical protein